MADTVIYVKNKRKCPPNVYCIYQLNDSHFGGLVMDKLMKLAKMEGVMHETDHAYVIWIT